MKVETVEKIRGRFDNEWLLIAVDEINEELGVPVKGHLIAHSPRREVINEESKRFSGVAYIVYSEDWPEDLAACFFAL